jgi:hypothetical protein
LIGAGIRFNEGVPSPASFNHLITHLTLDGKPVWLDTTAEVAPFGMLTLTTRDKQALVIPHTQPATIVRTPIEPLVSDAITFDAVGSLDATGVSTSHIVLTFRGDGEIVARAAFRLIPADQYDHAVQMFSSAIGFTGTATSPDVSRPTDTTQLFKLSYDYKREKAGDWDHLKTVPQVMPMALPRVTDIDPPVHTIQLGAPRTEVSTSSMKLPDGWTHPSTRSSRQVRLRHLRHDLPLRRRHRLRRAPRRHSRQKSSRQRLASLQGVGRQSEPRPRTLYPAQHCCRS